MPNGLRATASALASAGAVLLLFGNAVASERDVSLHDMNAMEWVKLGTGGLAAKTVIGDTASFIIGSLEPGAATRPHDHVFETITYGIEGDLVNTVAGFVARNKLSPKLSKRSIIDRATSPAHEIEIEMEVVNAE